MESIFDIFRQEAREHTAALEKGFLDLEAAGSAADCRPIIDELFRHAHSLKGAARSVGEDAIQQSAQPLEDTLGDLRDHLDQIDGETISRGLSQLDAVNTALTVWEQAKGLTPSAESTGHDDAAGDAVEDLSVRVPAESLDRMLNLVAELRIAQRGGSALAEQMASLNSSLIDVAREYKRFVVGAGAAASEADTTAARSGTLAGLRDQLDTTIDQLKRLETEFRSGRGREAILLQSLDADIRQARLLPLSQLTDSLHRTVRDLGQSLRKSIRFDVDVQGVFLDRAVIDGLREPLIHMLRNAAHHGLETPSERRRAGKPQTGTIRLCASRRGGQVRVILQDDGRGVNFERIRQRLRERRLVDESVLAELSEKALGKYLFEPGFTTTETVDAVSGRGVGLDVVLDAVRRLHGSIDLQSDSSEGTSLIISIPLSVSTIRILTVSANGQWFGVPSALVVRTGQVRQDQLTEIEGATVLTVDGKAIRWVHLGDLLTSNEPIRRPAHESWRYLLLELEESRFAVAVDDAEDEAEVVLKPLGFPLRGLPGVFGATIRPDGDLQIVLDPATLHMPRKQANLAEPELADERAGRILVVDDSPTTRIILRSVLVAEGYTVHTATDGVDALNRLRTRRVDLVVSDVTMPRMDGLALTREIKAQFGLPVVLVTSMDSEDHRRQGLQAGADAYLVKSTLRDEGLIETIRQLI